MRPSRGIPAKTEERFLHLVRDGERLRLPSTEPLEPGVVEDLRQVAAARVGEQRHDDVVGPEVAREDDRGRYRHPARAADKQPLLVREPPRHRDRVAVGDGHDPVGHVRVVRGGHERLADAFEEPRAPAAAGVDGAVRIGADHLHAAAGDLLEVLARAGDRPAGADTADEVRDPPLRLLPDLRAGGRIVRSRVGRVRVLVELDGVRALARDPRRDVAVEVGRIGRRDGRADDDLGAERAQDAPLLLGDLVGAGEDAPVALELRDEREADAGVPRGRLDDRRAGAQRPVALRRLDHRERRPVLHASARVQELELREHLRLEARGDAPQAQERRGADQVEERLADVHQPAAAAGRGAAGSPSSRR